ncbi:MAG: Lrp/AsnC family transcriptional regulator [Kosmotogaceae bacterium]|nr:Lrp/AsnC family transcriptional regulator [Kosmotogaceae bacterium]
MDKTDVEIVKTLLGNSRLSAREVARNSGVSVGTVISRTKILENEGVIKGYAVMMDHEKLGYELTVVTEIIVSKGKLLETDREIAKIPNVVAVYDVTGESDAVVIAKFKSREELSGFTKKLLSMPYVERTNTHVVLTTVKEDFRLLP